MSKTLRAGEAEISFVQEGKTEVALHADRLEVTGKASGYWKGRTWTNREGKLVLYENGGLDARNAEVFAPNLYVNGYVEKRGDVIKAWGHGDTAVNDGHTVVIDRNSGYGMKVNQAKSLGEVAQMTLQQIDAAFSDTRKTPRSPEELEALRAQGRTLPITTGNQKNGDFAMTILSYIDGKGQVVAQGRGEVGFYGDGEAPKVSKPYFVGKDGASRLDLESNGETSILVQGRMSYSDGKIAADSQQNNAVVRIFRNKGDGSDFIQADCYDCADGEGLLMHQFTPIGNEQDLGITRKGLFKSVDPAIFSVTVSVAEGKARFDLSKTALGGFAEDQQAGIAVFEKSIFEIPSEERQQLHLQAEEGRAKARWYQLDEEGNERVPLRAIDFGVHQSMGRQVIVTGDVNAEKIGQLLAAGREGKLIEFLQSGVKFDDDPALRQLLKTETGLDIEGLENPEYVRLTVKAIQQRQEIEKYGITLSSEGYCQGEECKKIDKATAKNERLAYLYTAARINHLEAEKSLLEAQEILDEKEGKDTTSAAISRINQELRGLQSWRRQMNAAGAGERAAAEVRKRFSQPSPEGYEDHVVEAENLGVWRGQLDAEIAKAETGLVQAEEEYQKSSSKGIYSRGAQERKNVFDVQKEMLQTLLAERDLAHARTQELVNQYYLDRPDLAGKLAAKAQDAEIISRISEDPLFDGTESTLLRMRAEEARGNLRGVALEHAQLAGASLRVEVRQEAEGILFESVIKQTENELQKRRQRFEEKTSQLLTEEEWYHGPLSYLEELPDTTLQILTSTVSKDVSFDDKTFRELNLEATEESLNQLGDDVTEAKVLLVKLKKAHQEGKTVAQAFEGIGKGEYAYVRDQSFVRAVEMRSRGEEPSRELLAREALDEVDRKRTAEEGQDYWVTDELHEIAETYAGTPAGAEAAARAAEFEGIGGIVGGALQTREGAYLASQLTADPLNLFAAPVFAGIRIATAPVRALVQTEKAAKFSNFVAKGSNVIAAGSKAFAATDIGRLILAPARGAVDVAEVGKDLVVFGGKIVVAKPLSFAGEVVTRALGTTGRKLADNVIAAGVKLENSEKALVTAQAAGDVAEVMKAQEAVIAARTAVQQANEVTQAFGKAKEAQVSKLWIRLGEFGKESKKLDTALSRLKDLASRPEVVAALRRGETPAELFDAVADATKAAEKVDSVTLASRVEKAFGVHASQRAATVAQQAQAARKVAEVQKELERFQETGGVIKAEATADGRQILRFEHPTPEGKKLGEDIGRRLDDEEVTESGGFFSSCPTLSFAPAAAAGAAVARERVVTFFGRAVPLFGKAAAENIKNCIDPPVPSRSALALAEGRAVKEELALQRAGRSEGILPEVVYDDPAFKREMEDLFGDAEGISLLDRPNIPVISGETELVIKEPDLSQLLPTFSKETVGVIDQLGIERRVGAGGKSKTFPGLEKLPEEHPLRELGLEQAIVFETAEGRVVIKPVIDNALEQKIGSVGKTYLHDTAKRDIGAKNLLTAAGNHVADTRVVQLSDGTKLLVSEYLPGLQSLGKRNYAPTLEKVVQRLPIPAEEQTQALLRLSEELERYTLTNLALNNADAELAVAKLADGQYHVVGFDFELAFQGMQKEYIAPWETKILTEAKSGDIRVAERVSSTSGNDLVAGMRVTDIFPQGTQATDEVVEVIVAGKSKEIASIEVLLKDEEKIVFTLMDVGYDRTEAEALAKQLATVDLEERLRKVLKNDGQLLVSHSRNGELLTKDEALAHGRNLAERAGVKKSRAEVLGGEVKPLEQKGVSVPERRRARIAEARAEEAGIEIQKTVPSVDCALSGFGCVKVLDKTPPVKEDIPSVPKISEVGEGVKAVERVEVERVAEATEKPSTLAKLWPFGLNKHRKVEVPGVEFSTLDITIPGIPNKYASITEGDVTIQLFKKKVLKPSNFDNQLEFGDDFLQLHVDVKRSKVGSISAGKDAIKAFDKLKQLDLGIPIVGDTTNQALLKQAEKLGGKRIKAPDRVRIMIEEGSGPIQEGDAIVERVIILPGKVAEEVKGVEQAVESVPEEFPTAVLAPCPIFGGAVGFDCKNVVQTTTRGDGTLQLTEETFTPAEMDFQTAKQHLKIHHEGAVAGSQFNGRVFGSADEVENVVRQSLPSHIQYDQYGRAEITLDLRTPTGEPVGFTGIMSKAELEAKYPGIAISKKTRTPGGIAGEKDSIKGTWYPESVRDESGKFVVKMNPDGSVANPNFKFEPDALIAEVPQLPGTHKVTVILEKSKDTGKPEVLTVYPGESAPAFPAHIEKFKVNTLQNSQEARFWDEHVFLQVKSPGVKVTEAPAETPATFFRALERPADPPSGEIYKAAELGMKVPDPLEGKGLPAGLQKPPTEPHIIVFSPPELKQLTEERAAKLIAEAEATGGTLSKGKARDAAKNQLVDEVTKALERKESPKYLGVGRVAQEDNEVFYVVTEWPTGQEIRAKYGLPEKDFHVTLGFKQNDIHGVSKGKETLVEGSLESKIVQVREPEVKAPCSFAAEKVSCNSDLIAGKETWTIDGKEYLYDAEKGWSKKEISDLTAEVPVSEQEFLALELARNERKKINLPEINTLFQQKGEQLAPEEWNRVIDFLGENPNALTEVPGQYAENYNKLLEREKHFREGLEKIRKGLVQSDDSSFISLQATGVTLLEDEAGNLIVRYGDMQINLADPALKRRDIFGNYGAVIESREGVETVFLQERNGQYRIGYIEKASAPRIPASEKTVAAMSSDIEQVLTESTHYLDIQIEEGELSRLRAKHPEAFDGAMYRRYHDITPEQSAMHRRSLYDGQIQKASKLTKIESSQLERAVQKLAPRIQQQFLADMPHTHTTATRSLDYILGKRKIEVSKPPSRRDGMKGAQGDIFTFRKDPGSLEYGDVTFVFPAEKFGSETIFLPGDLKNGVQRSYQSGEESISFGTKSSMALHAGDADELLASTMAMDIIARKAATGKSLDEIVQSLSKEDVYRYYVEKTPGRTIARINDLTAFGRFEGHTPGIDLLGSTMFVDASQLTEVELLLQKHSLLGEIRVIGVEGKWGRWNQELQKVEGGSNTERMKVFAYISGLQEGELTPAGENIFRLKVSDLPDLKLPVEKTKPFKVRLFEELNIPNNKKGEVGKRISELEKEGKSEEEIKKVIASETS